MAQDTDATIACSPAVSTHVGVLDRPTLEYAASVWDPRLAKYRTSIEAVQRKAARFVHGDYRRRAIPQICYMI